MSTNLNRLPSTTKTSLSRAYSLGNQCLKTPRNLTGWESKRWTLLFLIKVTKFMKLRTLLSVTKKRWPRSTCHIKDLSRPFFWTTEIMGMPQPILTKRHLTALKRIYTRLQILCLDLLFGSSSGIIWGMKRCHLFNSWTPWSNSCHLKTIAETLVLLLKTWWHSKQLTYL